jgi:AcrR family transcriptional regulator
MTAAPVNFAQRVKDRAPECVAGAKPVRHRRRGAALEDAIHDAVFDELAEIGYAAFTIESVAARAHTGKASIYRRWPTKQELVLDAFCAKFGESLDLLAGSLDERTTTRDVLLQVARRMCAVAAKAGEAIRAAACEMSRDAALAAAMDEQVNDPKREMLLTVLKRGVERGEVRPQAACDLIADVLPAMITFRLILENRPVTDDHLVRVIDDVVMPLVRPA